MTTTTKDPKALEREYHIQLYRRYPLTLVRGEGVRVWDDGGNEYIDALAGIAVTSLGHSHPAVVNAIKTQAEKLIHVSNFYFNEPQSKLAELLCCVSGMDRVFFCNSGAEAVEAALKLARRYADSKNHKGNIVSLEHCFHGRTLATIAMGSPKYQAGFAPMPEGFECIPGNDLKVLERTMSQKPIAIILEVVQGEGGIRPAPKDYLKKLRELCSKNDTLLILDEIQCGVGRTGAMFAFQHYGIKPDIMTSAKALGNGVPIGAMLATQNVAEAFQPGNHGTTYGGNPLACAAACAVIETMTAENLPQKASENGDYAMTKIREAAKGWDAVKEVRGLGLMIGVDLAFKGAEVVARMMKKGVLANCTADTVIRLVPPLTIERQDLDRVIDVLIESVREVEEGTND